MRISKTASGKQTVKISRKEWIGIGKVAKWIDKKRLNKKAFEEEEWGDISQYESMGSAQSLFDQVPDVDEKRRLVREKIDELTEEELDAFLESEGISLYDLDIDENDEASRAAQEQIAAEEAMDQEPSQVEEGADRIRQEYLEEADRPGKSLSDYLDD